MKTGRWLVLGVASLLSAPAFSGLKAESYCRHVLKTATDPFSTILELRHSIIPSKSENFSEMIYEHTRKRLVEGGRPLDLVLDKKELPLETYLALFDHQLSISGNPRTVRQSLDAASRASRAEFLREFERVMRARGEVTERTIDRLSILFYTLSHGLPMASYEVLLGILKLSSRETLRKIVDSSIHNFLVKRSFREVLHHLDIPFVAGTSGTRAAIKRASGIAIFSAFKAVGILETDSEILRIAMSSAFAKEVENSSFEDAVLSLNEKFGKRLRNKAKFESALALSGAIFSVAGTYELFSFLLKCDPGADLPPGVLPVKPCGEAARREPAEIRAILIEGWRRTTEASAGYRLEENDPDLAYIRNYYENIPEEELRRLYTKILTQSKNPVTNPL